MIELKKYELEPVLLQITTFKQNVENGPYAPISGLMLENLPLKEKRKLQKIQKKVLESYQELLKDAASIKEELKDNKEELEKETKTLLEETVKIDLEKASLVVIDEIKSSVIYNFDLIEKIAE